MVLKSVIRKYALQNAIKFNGKANPGAVIGQILNQDPKAKQNMKETAKLVNEIIREISKLSVEEQTAELKKSAPELLEKKKQVKKKELKDLKNAKKGKVIMRFAPSPSGPMHLGHAFAISLNSELCRKYDGKLILRIDDTNPMNIYEPAYKLIPEDAKWLTKKNVWKVMHQSDMMGKYYDYAEKIISDGHAYVCECIPDRFRELSINKKACPCRDLPAKEHLLRWAKMFGEYKPGDAVVRIKTDIKHKNPAMRDWPALRINDHKHPRTGDEHRVWPLMNFAVAIDDIETGVTHTIRAKDHMDNEKRQKYIFDFLNKKMPEHLYVGKINFKGLSLSSSETRKKIEYKEFDGWDDIRLPFMPALRRRGYQPEAFIKYSIDVGVSENDKTVAKEDFFKTLNHFNKEVIDPVSNRYFFVKNPVEIKIEKAEAQKVEIPLHPDKPKKGKRRFETKDKFYIAKDDKKELKDGKLIRLMDCLNFTKKGSKFIFDSFEYEKYKGKGKKIIHWLPVQKELVSVEVLMPDKKKVKGLAEPGVANLKEGSIVQFERFGFVRLDKKDKDKLLFWFGHR